jgi:hypothetical protein
MLFWVMYKANFGEEFSFAKSIPETNIYPLKIDPDFKNRRLKMSLARGSNECELIWQFPERIQTSSLDLKFDFGALSSRNALRVQGIGDWDAVYSGKPEDREPELVWNGAANNPNGRWPTFGSYVAEYWKPVLKQLVCATHGVNIIQQTRYKYRIDIYRANQVGSKDARTGEYSFIGTPIETLTVENPSGDDAQAGKLKITTSGGIIYQLSLTQTLGDDQNVTSSTWDYSGTVNGGTFISKNVTVTPATVEWASMPYTISQPCKVIDNTSVDGVNLPKVTTTYWVWPEAYYMNEFPEGQWIDKIIEEGIDGSRTTSYTYEWKDASSNLIDSSCHVIDHLTGITQTGGQNPYTAEYDSAGLLTHYADTYGSMDVSYSGNKVTRTEKLNNQPVRTFETTYSGDMTQATTVAK